MAAFDLAIVLASWLVSAGGLLLWIHRSSQTAVPRSWPHSRMVLVRLAVLYAAASLPVGIWLPGLVGPLAIALPVVVLLMSQVSLGWLEAADGPGSFGLAILFSTPFYALRQYVLGFPDRNDLVLSPPASRHHAPASASRLGTDAEEADGSPATVIAPLRPAGLVEIAGNRAEAMSFDGGWIATGTAVEVCGRRNRTLVVRPVSANKAATPTPSETDGTQP